jgi:porin
MRSGPVCLCLLLAGVTPALAQEPAPTATQPETVAGWLKSPEMFGDWGGLRTKLREKGTTVEASFTQFFDWVPVGDDDRGYDYGGKVIVDSKSDLSRFWKGFFVEAGFEMRYGDVPLLAGGTLIPTSTALLFPENEGTHAKLNELKGTKIFDDKYVFEFGRFNTLELYNSHPFTGGEGIDRFMNLSLVSPPPISARTIPPVAEGVLFSVLKGPAPVFTAGLIESTEDGFFKNGATFLWNYSLPVKMSSDKPGGIAVGGEFGSFLGTSLDQSPWAIIPPITIPLAQVRGAWTFNVTVDQYLWMHPNDPTKGFGVFGMLGISDGNPSILGGQAFLGFGGAAPFEGRSADTWGAAYFYDWVSNDLADTLEPFIPTRNEQGAELFYNWAVTGWSRLTADFQLIDPAGVRAETRAFFAVRWKLIF